MEMLFAPVVVLLVALGLGLGLLMRGRPLQSSCGGMSCLPDEAHCAGCPKSSQGAQIE